MNGPTLERQQEVVRLYAYPFLVKAHIDPSRVNFLVSDHQISNINFISGYPCTVIFRTPGVFDHMNTWIKDVVYTLQRKRHELIRAMDIVPMNYYRDMKNKWQTEIFKGREEEIILDLIIKQRIKVTRLETLTLEDTQTGEKVSISKESVEKFHGDNIDLWLKLSRQVRDKDAKTIYLEDEA